MVARKKILQCSVNLILDLAIKYVLNYNKNLSFCVVLSVVNIWPIMITHLFHTAA